MKKQHYHLVSGSVMFVDNSDPADPRPGNFVQNATLRTPSREVPAARIGEAQQALQMLMFQKLNDPTLVVTDVHIQCISYLGLMTEEEFMKPVNEPKAPTGPTPIDPRLS